MSLYALSTRGYTTHDPSVHATEQPLSPTPIWSSAALKGLYRPEKARSKQFNKLTAMANESKVSKLRRMFSNAGVDDAPRVVERPTMRLKSEGADDGEEGDRHRPTMRLKVTEPDDDGPGGSTRATLGRKGSSRSLLGGEEKAERRRSSTSRMRTTEKAKDRKKDKSKEKERGTHHRSRSSASPPTLTVPVEATIVLPEDVAASAAGLQFPTQEPEASATEPTEAETESRPRKSRHSQYLQTRPHSRDHSSSRPRSSHSHQRQKSSHSSARDKSPRPEIVEPQAEARGAGGLRAEADEENRSRSRSKRRSASPNSWIRPSSRQPSPNADGEREEGKERKGHSRQTSANLEVPKRPKSSHSRRKSSRHRQEAGAPPALAPEVIPLPYPLDDTTTPFTMPRPSSAPGPSSSAASAAAAATSSQEATNPRRISLTALRHVPKSKPKRRSSEPDLSSKKKEKEKAKEKEKVQYYYDSERNLMVRKGLYNDGYRPKEKAEGRDTDLFRKVWEARVWGRVAEKVLR